MSSITLTRDNRTGELRFSGVVTMNDLERVQLDNFGRLLLNDCSSADATGADWLLALEYIFRRSHEAKKLEQIT